MTLCPIALLVGCRKCLLLKICPLKSVIGDNRKTADARPRSETGKEQDGTTPAKQSGTAAPGESHENRS